MGDTYALVSPGGAPGVTTAALALALTWPDPVIVAECDPSGGDVLAGLLTGHVPAGRGLMEHAIDAGRSSAAAASSLRHQLLPLDETGRGHLLAGLTDPRQATGLAAAWPAVSATFAAQPEDIIADCGRLDSGPSQPLAVLASARVVALVLRPTLRQVWAARPRLTMLAGVTAASRIVLLVTGPGTHTPREVSQALGVPVAGVLPDDPRSAALLSDGSGGRRQLAAGALLRSARSAGEALRRSRTPEIEDVSVPAGAVR